MFLENFKVYNLNEVIMQTQRYFFSHNWVNQLFSEENKVPRTQFEARKVAGSATYINKVNEYYTASSFKVTLFIQLWNNVFPKATQCPSKWEYFPVLSLLYDVKLNMFGLWTKQDSSWRHLGLLGKTDSLISDHFSNILQPKQLLD